MMKISPYFVFALLISTPLYAADSVHTPSGANYQIKASEVGSWESNPLKLAHGAKGLWGSTTTPELIIENTNATSKYNLDVSVPENLYDQSAYNSTDFHGKLGATKMNERWQAGVNGRVDYDTARTSELTTFGLNLPKVERFGLAASPTVSFKSSALDTFAVSSTLSRYTYNNAAFTDYDMLSVSPSYARHLTPNDSAILTLNAQRYQTQQGPNNKVNSYGPTLGWQSVINSNLATTLTAGFEKSSQNSTIATSKSTNMNYVFKGDVAYKTEQDNAHAVASRAHQPFGNGTETLLNSFTVNEAHALNPTVSLNAAAGYEFAEYNSIVGTNLNHQLSTTLGASYRVLDNLDVTGNYQYTSESLTNVGGSITDNAVLLGLTYHPRADAF